MSFKKSAKTLQSHSTAPLSSFSSLNSTASLETSETVKPASRPSLSSLTRREMIKRTSCGLFGLGLWNSAPFLSKAFGSVAPGYEILNTQVLSEQNEIYYGWPTVGLTATGELLVVVSGGRENHICPFGRVDLFRSKDRGQTWTWPQTIYDGPIDDRDAGVLVTPQGTILVTTFTSLAYQDLFFPEKTKQESNAGTWDDARFRHWQAVEARISQAEKEKELGCWMIRSTDGGITWSERYSSQLNSPHGPICLSENRLLYPGKAIYGSEKIGVVESLDDGVTWGNFHEIPTREGDSFLKYHELHGVEAANGDLIVQIRNENPDQNAYETLQTESSDGGQTWSVPHEIGVWGMPSHLIRLKDDRLLMTYGHRRTPFGNQARVSQDCGKTWSEPILVSQDGTVGDLGYPSTVQFDDDTLFSVWYEKMQDTPKAVLRFAHWRLS